ncbi:hypothetical protein, conserved [Babesia bigemina]|uniref:4Fe-4S ferredoxin-type domain-containing protein n=1 Tax=Babesia bigemina TaxID=5866 RepID=A0A061D7V2_BABBI|nr:hypothetical protein, conserved [Babesia bigemina]CDR96623.1 hypothetical protein, conserved [Babesia bigemina]|eukprot:XP_012768809.1 hypothetical protein, conserved [Babesia bigemina]
MDGEGNAEPEYYFDVAEQQWWVLQPGGADWEELDNETAESLGLHEAVMQQQCTFVESTLEDYTAAATCIGEAQGTDEPAVDHTQSLLLDPVSMPSIQFGVDSRADSLHKADSSEWLSSCLDDEKPERHENLQVRFSQHTQALSRGYTTGSMGEAGSGSDCDNRVSHGTASSALLNDRLSSLLTSTANMSLHPRPESGGVPARGESYVRSAVRRATRVDAGLSDCIRAVAAERERMRTLTSTQVTEATPGERYQKMIDRARTLAMFSQEQEPEQEQPQEKAPDEHRESMLRELRLEVTGGEPTADPAFGASSDSESEPKLAPYDSLQSLMSQRLSLRRTMSRPYEEGVVLERMFQLLKRNRCATCLVRKPTHVDPDRDELLCASCVRRCPYAAKVGDDHIPMAVVERLEAAYSRSSRGKNDTESKSEKKKHSSHRRKRSPSPRRTYASPSVSVERPKYSHHRKQWNSSASVSTEGSVYDRTPTRSKHRSSHRGRHASVSSGSVTPRGVSSARRVEDDLFVGAPSGWDDFDSRPARMPGRKSYDHPPAEPRRIEEARHASSRHHNPAARAPDMRAPRPQVDPYGYELPVTDDMPGMMGIMANRSTARDVGRMMRPADDHFNRPREIVDRPEYYGEAYDARYMPHRTSRPEYDGGEGDRKPPMDYGMHANPYAPRNKAYNGANYDYNPPRNDYAAPPPRPVGSNPFAQGANGGADRFDMSSLRLALAPSAPNPAREPRATNGRFDAVPPQPSGVAVYGGLYGRRTRR